jgi:hypothetical protein
MYSREGGMISFNTHGKSIPKAKPNDLSPISNVAARSHSRCLQKVLSERVSRAFFEQIGAWSHGVEAFTGMHVADLWIILL